MRWQHVANWAVLRRRLYDFWRELRLQLSCSTQVGDQMRCKVLLLLLRRVSSCLYLFCLTGMRDCRIHIKRHRDFWSHIPKGTICAPVHVTHHDMVVLVIAFLNAFQSRDCCCAHQFQQCMLLTGTSVALLTLQAFKPADGVQSTTVARKCHSRMSTTELCIDRLKPNYNNVNLDEIALHCHITQHLSCQRLATSEHSISNTGYK